MKPKTYHVQPKKGFTLIELIIVMAISAIIATISLANYRAGEKRKRVALASDSVISTLRLAQTYSLSGKSTNNANPACRVPQYYYISFTFPANIYTLYAMDNCSTADTIEVFSLPVNTRVSALSVDGTGALGSLRLAIYPPFGQIKSQKDGASIYSGFTTSVITVSSSDNTVTKTITLDGVSGKIGE